MSDTLYQIAIWLIPLMPVPPFDGGHGALLALFM